MGDLLRAYRAARGDDRSRLPRFEEWEVVDLGGREGVFTVGRALGMAGRLRWQPFDGEPPHCLVTGSTGGGKTSLMATWALLPHLWNRHYGADWDQTLILDPKGGGGYDAALACGARVVTGATEIRDALRSAYNHAERRNRIMGEMELHVTDKRDILRGGWKPKIFRDLTPEQRLEYRIRPQLLIIDEASDLLGKAEKDSTEVKGVWAQARAHLRQLVQKARSAGIVVVVGLQRPDAAILDGFTRDQLQARVAVGDMGPEGFRMVLGPTLGKRADEEGASMTPGQAWTTHIGGRRASQAYVAKVDLTAYLPLAGEAAAPPDPNLTPLEGGGLSGVRGWDWSWLVGVWVRWWLRLVAWRWLVGPVVVGPFERSARLRGEHLAVSGWRCQACGRRGQVEVDHVRPLWAGGADVAENLRTLCQRPGKPSCHRAKSSGEAAVRALRYRSGTAAVSSRVVALVRAVPPYRWPLAGLILLGLAHRDWWIWAAAVLVAVGPVWAWARARAIEGHLEPRNDGGADPGIRRQAWFDQMEARKMPRRFRWARVLGFHRRAARVTVARAWILRAAGCYLAGAWMLTVLGHAWSVLPMV